MMTERPQSAINVGSPTGATMAVLDQPWWRQRWGTLLVGWAFAFAFGTLFAAWLTRLGDWNRGFAWERALLTAIHRPLPHVIDVVVTNVQWFGTNLTLIPAVAIAALWLWVKARRPRLAMRLLIVQTGAYLLVPSLKAIFERERPALFERRGWYTWSAYPSGHSITSIAVLLTIAIMLHKERGWLWPYFVVIPVSLLSIYSRLYMGVHWPTDVVAGVLVGAIWLAMSMIAFRAPTPTPAPTTTPSPRTAV